jgi:hypothetical protein
MTMAALRISLRPARRLAFTATAQALPSTGLIDEVEFFDTVLSEAQIAAIFAVGGAGKSAQIKPHLV